MSARQSSAATPAAPQFAVINIADLRKFLNEIIDPLLADTKPALVDRAALARELSISTASLDHLRKESGFPVVQVGPDSPRFIVRDVVAWLQARTAGETS